MRQARELRKNRHHIRVEWVSFYAIILSHFVEQMNSCWIYMIIVMERANEFKAKTPAIISTATTKTITGQSKKIIGENKIQSHSCIWQEMMRDNFNDTIENQAMKMKLTAQNIRECLKWKRVWERKRDGQRKWKSEEHKIEMIILIVAENYEIS